MAFQGYCQVQFRRVIIKITMLEVLAKCRGTLRGQPRAILEGSREEAILR